MIWTNISLFGVFGIPGLVYAGNWAGFVEGGDEELITDFQFDYSNIVWDVQY